MKQEIQEFLSEQYPDVGFVVSYPPEGFGDYSTNLAFLLAKEKKENPQKLALSVVEGLEKEFKNEFEKIEIAQNGFINFYLSKEHLLERLKEFLNDKIKFPKIESKKINIEFVSANPTGPLTVGNARAASFGDTLGNIFKKIGHEVTKEYYINDVGVQVDKLTESIRLRMLELKGEKVEFSPDLYQGEYIKEIAKEFIEKGISEENIQVLAVKLMTDRARITMQSMGVIFDEWFSESRLYVSGEVEDVLGDLRKKGFVITRDGAEWLEASGFESTVVVKSNKMKTYVMNDIAYTKNKFEKRGFDKAINIWGADHHGDVPRLKMGIKLIGINPSRLEILLHQLVSVKEKGEIQKMSKRAGKFVLLDELLSEVGKDAVRFFFLTKDLNTHMEFDVELAKEESSKNPVYYIQYAFARINSVFDKAGNIKISEDLKLIKEKEELDLIRYLIRFPEVIFEISQNYQIHHLPQYALELAGRFHKFYEKQRIISEDEKLTGTRLALVKAVQIILGESLILMGLETPKRM